MLRLWKSQLAAKLIVLGSIISVIITGYGNGTARAATSPIAIMYWSSGPTNGIMPMVNGFNKEYHGTYQVTFRSIPYASEFAQINTALPAHKQPDIMEESTTPSLYYAYEGLEVPIEPLLHMVGIDPARDFPPATWASTTVNGVHYGAPLDTFGTLLFYNKKLFKAAGLDPNRPPTNAASFISDAKKLTISSKRQWGFMQDPEKDQNDFEFPSFVYQFGGNMADASTGKIYFGSSAGVKALTFEWNLIYKDHVSPVGASTDEFLSEFQRGKAAMTIAGTYAIPGFEQVLGKNLGVALLPVIGKQQADFIGDNFWWVFKSPSLTSAKERGIALFMKYWYDHSALLAQAGIPPDYLPVLDQSSVLSLPYMKLQEAAIKYGRLNPLIPNWGTVTGLPLYNQIDLALLNRESIPGALHTAAVETGQLMKSLPGFADKCDCPVTSG